MFSDLMIILLFLKGKYSVWGLVYEFHGRDEIVLCSAEEISTTSAHIILKLSFKLFLSLSGSPFYLCAISYNFAESFIIIYLQTFKDLQFFFCCETENVQICHQVLKL